jgi:signal transduction histidine kinase
VRVRVSAQMQADGKARLSFIVADTGAGMSRSHLAQIFSRTKLCADGAGPGLGLAISLRLAKLMGGQITAQSEIGQGSMFVFTLDAPVLTTRVRTSAA